MTIGRRELAALLVVVCLVAYARVVQLGFIDLDDPLYVSQNPNVLAGISASSIAWAFTTTTAQNWHPLTWLSLMLDATLGEANPHLYHLTNLLLHIGNTLLLFFVFTRLTGLVYRSAFVAALFAIHPLHVESVAWIAERKDVLSTLFWLLTTAAWVRWIESRKPAFYALMLALYAAGLMSKPMLVTLPLTLLLLESWPLRRDISRAASLREKAPLFALAGASSVVTWIVQRPAMRAMEGVPFGERIANAMVSYVVYLGQTIWPSRLAVFYPYHRGSIELWTAVGAAIVLVGVTVVAMRSARTRPWLSFGWLWYVVTLVPVIGLVQVGLQARADRYTYVPLLGIFVAVAWSAGEALQRAPILRAAAASFVVVGLAACTFAQVGHWRSDVELFAHAVEVTKDNAFAHFKLSAALEANGEVEPAVVHLREALRIDPEYANAHFNLTGLLARQGRVAEVEVLCREEQARWPSAESTLVHAGVLAYLQGNHDEAAARFQEALRLYPVSIEARHNLEVLRAEP